MNVELEVAALREKMDSQANNQTTVMLKLDAISGKMDDLGNRMTRLETQFENQVNYKEQSQKKMEASNERIDDLEKFKSKMTFILSVVTLIGSVVFSFLYDVVKNFIQ